MRTIAEIAREIRATWKNVSPYAQPYLDAMRYLSDKNSTYFYDDATSVVLYFLSNAASWRGEDARRIKKELRAVIA